jgi:hypothetical protein
VPFDSLAGVFVGPRKAARPPTEGFLNFSADLVRRAAGQHLKGSADQDGARRLDQVCGGDWWRAIATARRPRDSSDNFEPIAVAVADEYARRLGSATNMRPITVPVKRKLEHQPIYHLIFLTRHPEGVWSFADSLGAARPDWLEAMPDGPDLSEPDLFTGIDVVLDGATLAAKMRRQALKEREDSVARLTANIKAVAASGKRFRVVDHVGEVLEGVLGVATEKQVRAALRGLVNSGQLTRVVKDKRSRIQRDVYEASAIASR